MFVGNLFLARLPRQVGRQVQRQVGIEHAQAFLGQARGDQAELLHGAGIHAITQLQGEGEHVDILRQRR